jgi:hypothetical protein
MHNFTVYLEQLTLLQELAPNNVTPSFRGKMAKTGRGEKSAGKLAKI